MRKYFKSHFINEGTQIVNMPMEKYLTSLVLREKQIKIHNGILQYYASTRVDKAKKTYCDNHIKRNKNAKLLWCTHEANIISYVSYTLIKHTHMQRLTTVNVGENVE